MKCGTEVAKANKQATKPIAAISTTPQDITAIEISSNSDAMSDQLIEDANKPPLKTEQDYSINQTEVLQSLAIFAFVSQFESDEVFNFF